MDRDPGHSDRRQRHNMYRPLLIIFCATLSIFPTVVLSASDARLAQTRSEQNQPTLPRLSIHYTEGVISGRINNMALGDVMRELARRTGANIVLKDVATAHHRISLVADALPFDLVVERMLDGFSYVLYRGEDVSLPALIILSSDPTTSPQSKVEPMAVSIINNQTAEIPVAEQEAQEARVEHAIATLRSSRADEQGAAVYTLVAAHDQRAMDHLVEAASASGTMEPQSKVHAVQVLWRHVADRALGDNLAIGALERLTQRGTEAVKDLAKRALQDIRHLQEANMAKQ